MLMKPTEINILGIVYRITYVDKAGLVDSTEEEYLSGQVSYRDREIRILDGGSGMGDIWSTMWHEILHALLYEGKMRHLFNSKRGHEDLDFLAQLISDTVIRNKLRFDDSSSDFERIFRDYSARKW